LPGVIPNSCAFSLILPICIPLGFVGVAGIIFSFQYSAAGSTQVSAQADVRSPAITCQTYNLQPQTQRCKKPFIQYLLSKKTSLRHEKSASRKTCLESPVFPRAAAPSHYRLCLSNNNRTADTTGNARSPHAPDNPRRLSA
jgi:hypothetical protein